MRLKFWFLVIAVIFQCILGPLVFFCSGADSNSNPDIDVALVVDTSKSMIHSDPKGISIEAMKMFIDMIARSSSQLGIVSYSESAAVVSPLLSMNDDKNRDELKKSVTNLKREGMFTDIATGVKNAAQMLDSRTDKSHKPVIVLLTDGKNDFSPQSGRTNGLAQKDIDEVKQKGYPVYAIGLNADGSVDKNYLQTLASDTGAFSYITADAKDLPDFLSNIFAAQMQLKKTTLNNMTANGSFQDVGFTIPDPNVIEANICLLSSKPVESELYKPDGTKLSIPGSSVYYSTSNTYTLLKIIKPDKGDWKLRVKGIAGDQIKINLIYNYDIKLIVDALKVQKYKKGDVVKITSHFESNGSVVQDKELYDSITGNKLIIKDLTANSNQEININKTATGFDGDFTIPESHKYQVVVRVDDGKSFLRESQPISIDASAAQVTVPPAGPPPSPQPPSPAPKSGMPWYYLAAAGLILLLLLAALFMFLRKHGGNPYFAGQFVIEIMDDNTFKKTAPQYKKINLFKGRFNLHLLLQMQPEYKETENIVFTPGRQDGVILKNRSGCEIQRGGRIVDASKGYEMHNGDKIEILLRNSAKRVFLEYIR